MENSQEAYIQGDQGGEAALIIQVRNRGWSELNYENREEEKRST